MSGKNLIFYSIETMYAIHENVLFLCDNEDEVSFYNSKLWTYSRLGFIPSGNKNSLPIEDAEFCHTWFSTDIAFANSPTCLLHNGLEVSGLPGVEKFNKVIDIFPKDLIEAAKDRFEKYKALEFSNYKLWKQNGVSWNAGEF